MKDSPAVRDCMARIYQLSVGKYLNPSDEIVSRMVGSKSNRKHYGKDMERHQRVRGFISDK